MLTFDKLKTKNVDLINALTIQCVSQWLAMNCSSISIFILKGGNHHLGSSGRVHLCSKTMMFYSSRIQ